MGCSSFRGGGGGNSNSINPNDIGNKRSLISERGRKQTEVDDVLSVAARISSEYNTRINDFQVVDIKGRSANAMAYYDGEDNLAVNSKYFDNKQITSAYDNSVKSGFHPSRGNKTAMEAVVSREFGHKLTYEAGKRMGAMSLHDAADKIVKEACKNTKHRGVAQMAAKISGYAKQNSAETVAEAFADVFCNGSKAKAESRAVVDVLNKYIKGGN